MPLAVTCIYGDQEIDVARAIEIKLQAERAEQAAALFLCTFCGGAIGPWGGVSPHFEHGDRNPRCLLSHVPRGESKRLKTPVEWQVAFEKLKARLESSSNGKYLKLYAQPRAEALLYHPDHSSHPLQIIEPDSLTRTDVFDSLIGVIEHLPVKADSRGFHRYSVRDWDAFVDVVAGFSEIHRIDSSVTSRPQVRGAGQSKPTHEGDAILRMVNVALVTARASGRAIFRVTKDKELGFPSIDAFRAHVTELVARNKGRCALTKLPLTFDVDGKDKAFLCSLDRIDSNGHYAEGNLQVVCRFVNRWKGNQPDGEFKRLLARVRDTK